MLFEKIFHWVSVHVGGVGTIYIIHKIFDDMGWKKLIIKKINDKLNIKTE